MIVQFKFSYLSENKILAYFLDFYAKNSGLKYSLHRKDKEISLYVEGESDELLKFGDESMNLIPNSIFLADSEVKIVEVAEPTNIPIPEMKLSNITPKMLKSKELVRNEFGILSSVSVFNGEDMVAVSEQNFDELLEWAFLRLLHNQKIQITDDLGVQTIIPYVDFTSNFIMPSNLLAISKMFNPDEKSLIAMASFERPIVNLKISAIFRKNHQNAPAFFDVKITKDLFLFKLFEKLYLNGVFFLSVKTDSKRFKITTLDERFLVVNHANFAPEIKPYVLNATSPRTTLFKAICTEFGIENVTNIHLNLSKTAEDFIRIFKDDKPFSLLRFNLPSSFEELKNQIIADEIGAKLLQNFEAKFGYPSGEIVAKDNFYSLFDITSKILFGKNADYLVQNAKEFLGKKGVKIDYKMADKTEFDTVKFIKSAMSYKLAVCDEKLLSYGIVESLAYFLSDYFDIIDEDLGFAHIVATGTLFEEKIFTSVCQKLIAKLKFSDEFGLENA